VNVEDKNDNAPVFIGGRLFSVEERCRAGKETFLPIKSRPYSISHQNQKIKIRINYVKPVFRAITIFFFTLFS